MVRSTRTPKAQALGELLRETRKGAGLTQRDLGEKIGRDSGTISRWESGERPPDPTDVSQFLGALGINGERYEEILAAARGTDAPRWLATTLPEQRRQTNALLQFERTAKSITQVAPLLIPGVLQTSDYIHAIMTAGGVDEEEIAARIALRIGRREVITRRDPVRVEVLLGEPAVRWVIGNRQLMAQQLEYILELNQLPNVDIRVIPYSSGWSPALEGMFMLIEFGEDESPVVNLENRRSGLFLHEAEDIDSYRQAVDRTRKVAMDSGPSTELIASVIKELETTA